jgi:hypothetical protein
MAINDGGSPSILAQKLYAQPSPFMPENLLCEARGQKRIPGSRIPRSVSLRTATLYAACSPGARRGLKKAGPALDDGRAVP